MRGPCVCNVLSLRFKTFIWNTFYIWGWGMMIHILYWRKPNFFCSCLIYIQFIIFLHNYYKRHITDALFRIKLLLWRRCTERVTIWYWKHNRGSWWRWRMGWGKRLLSFPMSSHTKPSMTLLLKWWGWRWVEQAVHTTYYNSRCNCWGVIHMTGIMRGSNRRHQQFVRF